MFCHLVTVVLEIGGCGGNLTVGMLNHTCYTTIEVTSLSGCVTSQIYQTDTTTTSTGTGIELKCVFMYRDLHYKRAFS